MRDKKISEDLLSWYDGHARVLPWRIGPKERAAGVQTDPYRIWLSEIMLQQTTVVVVRDYFRAFTTRWPNVSALAKADDSDVMAEWAGLGYYARARNLLKCARVIDQDFAGKFPSDFETLLSLPGIGPYTAAAISSIAFNLPEPVMDGNIERVISRLFAIKTPLPTSKPELFQHVTRLTPQNRPGDFAQAMMDLGATICKPRAPSCDICPLRIGCVGFAASLQNTLPEKLPKKAKPKRFGNAFVARRRFDGAWLLERRPPKGLLGNMLCWPSSTWAELNTEVEPPFAAHWQRYGNQVKHTFTHFHLKLDVHYAWAPDIPLAPNQFWMPSNELRPSDLPSLMRKVFKVISSDDLWN